jgi:beta-lactamase superfamily II metal-dependent hydrolase
MLIDCGEEDDGQEVVDNLTEQGVQKVDVLIITHFDKDHVGGADSVVKMIPVDRVLQPAYEGTSAEYDDFLTAMEEAKITPENVTQTQTFQFGQASITVEPPASYEIPDGKGEYDNNFSLITTVELGAKRLVFTGDAEKKRIREWLSSGTAQPCDFLKVPHHGVYNKALPELFETLHPAYAVMCDSAKNPADDRTLELLKQCRASTYQTKDGDISIVCDGESIAVTL